MSNDILADAALAGALCFRVIVYMLAPVVVGTGRKVPPRLEASAEVDIYCCLIIVHINEATAGVGRAGSVEDIVRPVKRIKASV